MPARCRLSAFDIAGHNLAARFAARRAPRLNSVVAGGCCGRHMPMPSYILQYLLGTPYLRPFPVYLPLKLQARVMVQLHGRTACVLDHFWFRLLRCNTNCTYASSAMVLLRSGRVKKKRKSTPPHSWRIGQRTCAKDAANTSRERAGATTCRRRWPSPATGHALNAHAPARSSLIFWMC